jgi:hypothetical protein
VSVSTRTNLIVNGSFETNVTGWAGTNCTVAQSAAAFVYGSKSMALTASAAAAFSVSTASGTSGMPVTANTSYALQIQSKAAATARTVTASINWYTAAGALISSWTGLGATDATTGFTQASLVTTSPATAAFASVTIAYNTAATSEVHYVDAVFMEAAATVNTYFDGASINANSVVYAWTGTAYASPSTATTYTPALSLVVKTDAPCPRVEVTITDVTPTDNVVNVWRTADGKRQAVRGARRWTVNGSNFVVDYETPLGRPVDYDLEIVSGVNYGAGVTTQTVSVASDTWWIQDPLVPSSAIALNVSRQDSSLPYLTAAAVKSLEYASGVTIVPILGSPEQVALMGQRTIAGNVDFSMFTNTATVTTQLRNLLQQTPLLLVRSNGVRNDGIPGLAYYAAAKPVEHPVTVAFGGTLTNWQLTGDLVAAPTMNVLVPVWTYGTVTALWATYQAAQTVLASKTYLDVLKSPSGA